tara:strand:+ start:127 stop:357 length:231 start_codon:yes stop_codon:yes gene_type:complete
MRIKMKNNIKKYLGENGLKSNWIAEQLDCHPTEVSNWISGRRVPSLSRAVRLANLLNCSVEDLFPMFPDVKIKGVK